jgi:hypothetical protein
MVLVDIARFAVVVSGSLRLEIERQAPVALRVSLAVRLKIILNDDTWDQSERPGFNILFRQVLRIGLD